MSKVVFETKGLESYIPNEDLERDIGIWLKFPGNRRFRCLRAGGANRRFVRAFQAALRPYKRQIDQNRMDPETLEEVSRTLYAQYVVIGWEGVNDAAGSPVPYNPENAVAFFEAFPELFNDIVTLCTEASTFSEQQIEEAQKTMGEA